MALKIALLTILLLCGCATTGTNSGTKNERGAVVIHVENYNWGNAVIYVMRGSSKVRLGSLRSGRRQKLYVPSAYIMGSNLQLYVRFVGERYTLTTDPVPVRPGQHVNFVIRNYLPFSTVFPRRFEPEGASYNRMRGLRPLRQAFSSQVSRGRTNV